MNTAVTLVDPSHARSMILAEQKYAVDWYQRRALDACLSNSANIWIGLSDDELVCMWGLVPPTILSDVAYLWLYTTDRLKDLKFTFIRQSQISIRDMLKQYPTIIGMVDVKNEKAIKWIRWLGGTFAEPESNFIPFTIRAKNG